MSASKDKGTRAESDLVRWLQGNGFGPGVERRALAGPADKGDVAGIPGLVIEIKAAGRYCIPAWIAETQLERLAAAADHGVLVVKPVGVGSTRVAEWWAIMPVHDIARLLRQAGYGDYLPPGVDEFECPACGEITRARMADTHPVGDR